MNLFLTANCTSVERMDSVIWYEECGKVWRGVKKKRGMMIHGERTSNDFVKVQLNIEELLIRFMHVRQSVVVRLQQRPQTANIS